METGQAVGRLPALALEIGQDPRRVRHADASLETEKSRQRRSEDGAHAGVHRLGPRAREERGPTISQSGGQHGGRAASAGSRADRRGRPSHAALTESAGGPRGLDVALWETRNRSSGRSRSALMRLAREECGAGAPYTNVLVDLDFGFRGGRARPRARCLDIEPRAERPARPPKIRKQAAHWYYKGMTVLS